jgi:hypothetical protein
MRQKIAIAVGGILVLALVVFAIGRLVSPRDVPAVVAASKPATCADAYRVLKLAPSQISAANPVCLSQSLKLSGEVTGQVAEAYAVAQDSAAPTAMCSVPKRWNAFPQALLALVAGGKAYRLRISAPGSSEHQPVSISNLTDVIELASISDPSQHWPLGTGKVMMNADGVTGTLDVNVLQDVSGAVPVHITGQWACGAPLPLPASAAGAPCASFYALNHLSAADVARMKARACHAVDLTFAGAVSAHLDHAVTDTVDPQAGLGGDNFCSAGSEEYLATLKFSIGDESFLLNLGASQYQGVTPGRYPADSISGIGVALFLGYADPSTHGDFVTDDKVFWVGSSGTFSIAKDMKSGTVDATVRSLTGNRGSTVRIKGSWRCAA